METPDHHLEPLPYQAELRDYLKAQERELWNWFASARAKADYAENLRLELHPEAYIRARALALWQEHPGESNAPIGAMLEGAGSLDELDLLGQQRLTSATRRLLESFLQPRWFQTPAILAHARQFYADFQPAGHQVPAPGPALRFSDPGVREYLCYVLLDFAQADPDLDEMPLAAAFEFSRQLELEEPFEKLAAKELKLRTRDLRRIKEQAASMLARAEAARE